VYTQKHQFQKISRPEEGIKPALGVTEISDDWSRSTVGVTGKFGNTSKCQRDLWVHLGVLLIQHRNHMQTMKDILVLIDVHSED